LKLFEAELDRILELGAEFVACSPETLDFPRRLKADYGFRFPMLSDVDCALSIDLGIAFLVPKEIQQDLTEMGIDLATRHGDSRCILPIPLTMVVNRTGEIVQNFVEEGRKVDLDGMAAVLSGLQQQGLLSTNL
jgi:peroxiredoxin